MSYYVGTQERDSDMFSRCRNGLWTALRNSPTGPIQILSKRVIMSHVYETRRDWTKGIGQTGSDPEQDAFRQAALRKAIIEALPLSAQSRVLEVVGVYNMLFLQFTDNVVHAVNKHRLLRQKKEDEDAMRKLTQQQLTAGTK